jgi:hypothetical protein
VASAAIDAAVREAKSIGIAAELARDLFRRAIERWYPGHQKTEDPRS